MKIVADSNVLISAVLWGGTPSSLFELVGRGEIQLLLSNEIADEVEGVLRRPKFTKRLMTIGRRPASIMRDLRLLSLNVTPSTIPRTVKDPDDDMVLGTALSGGADVIVSGDSHLLSIAKFRGIPILTSAQFSKQYYPEMHGWEP